jgi:hypothetical protein
MELYFMDELTSEEEEEGCEWPSDELPDLASSETDTSETYSDEEDEDQDQDQGYSIPLEFLSLNEAPLELAVGPPSPTGPLKLPAYSPSDEEACAFPDDGIMADNRHVRLSSLVDSTNLTTEQYGQLVSVLDDNSDVFCFHPSQLGTCKLGEHVIDTGDAAPIKQAYYRMPFKKQEELKKHVDEWLSMGVIRESNSPWASPLHLVPKKGGLPGQLSTTES